MPRLVLLSSLALAACSGGQPPRAPSPVADAPSAAASPFSFDWAPPCSVPAVEEIHANGHQFVFRYSVTVTRRNDQELVVKLVQFRVLALDGNDLTGPEHAAERGPAEQAFAATPRLVIGNDGTFQHAEGIDELLELALARDPPQERAATRALMSSPEAHAVLGAKYAEPWQAWVVSWIGWSVAPGETASIERMIPGRTGEAVPVTATAAHLGIVDGHAHLRYAERLDGEALVQAMTPTMRSLGSAVKSTHDVDALIDHIAMDGYREEILEVETRPESLRPRRSRREVRSHLSTNGGPFEDHVEIHTVEFDWTRAIGCGQ